MNILIFCPHPDDLHFGMGGAVLKMVEEKNEVTEVIFSAGQSSHPHLREKIIEKKRIKETEGISSSIGIKKTVFFGLADGKLKNRLENKDVLKRIKDIINKYKPDKVYIPSSLDPHMDHRAVSKTIAGILKEIDYKKEIFTYEIWNIVKENLPAVYIDITPYFKQKLEMLKQFKTQWLSYYLLLIPIYLRAKRYGKLNNCRYAEKFYKLQ